MEYNVPNYNPNHVVRLLTDTGFRKPGREKLDENKQSFLEPKDLIDDQPTIDSVMHNVLGELNKWNPRHKRAIDLVYGLPDSEPLTQVAAGKVFYMDNPQQSERRRHMKLQIGLDDPYIKDIADLYGISIEDIKSAELSISGDLGELYPRRTAVGSGTVAKHKNEALRFFRHRSRIGNLEALIKQ